MLIGPKVFQSFVGVRLRSLSSYQSLGQNLLRVADIGSYCARVSLGASTITIFFRLCLESIVPLPRRMTVNLDNPLCYHILIKLFHSIAAIKGYFLVQNVF